METVTTPAPTMGAGRLSLQDRLIRFIKQFAKFFIVGGINTAIDFAVLNVLMVITSIHAGKPLFILNCISFSVAVVNSYYMNRRWTFKEAAANIEDKQAAVQFSQFFIVSIIGILINSSIVSGFTSYVPNIINIGPQLWANVGKLFATGFSLIWNFIGYKFIVFKK